MASRSFSRHCESCGFALGYLPVRQTVTALRPDAGVWTALAAPGRRYRYCANGMHGVCNWLVPADGADQFCAACRHNRPDAAAERHPLAPPGLMQPGPLLPRDHRTHYNPRLRHSSRTLQN
jgi:hypothetical protein